MWTKVGSNKANKHGDKSEADDTKSKKKKSKSEPKDEHKKKHKDDEASKKKKAKTIKLASESLMESLDSKVQTNEVERLRKSHYIREEKLRNLRSEYASPEQLYQEMFAVCNKDLTHC